MIKYIDSHVHLDHIFACSPERVSWMKENRCLPISWSFASHVKSKKDIEQYLAGHAGTVRDLSRAGLECYYLAGIHPRNISSDLLPEDIHELITPYLDDPLCLGVGEIGLETGSTREEEILRAQLELAKEVKDRGKVFGIHTPRENKEQITALTLSLLSSFRRFKNYIVVDHCSLETIADVLSQGFWAGITLSSIKSSAEDVVEIIKNIDQAGTQSMLNTDSGTQIYYDLEGFIESSALSSEILKNITQGNAAQFFSIAFD